MSGPRLAHYELEAKIGEGGMGVVYRARDTRLDRPVAIKILPRRVHRDPEWRARFLREARAAARLNHTNLATIYEIDEADAPPALFGDTEPLDGDRAVPVLYIAMEFVEGEDLKTRLLRGPLDESEVVDFALQITRGLEAAHRAGIVHRDLKPHNLRVTPEGVVKILDFGLAKMLEVAQQPTGEEGTLLTTEGMVLGTAPYMSPEQVAGERVDARSDLFSLGVVLYEMAGGKVPYEGESLVRYVRNLTRTEAKPLSKVRPGVSRDLEAIVAQLLEKDPDERYASAAAVREDLEALVTGSIVSAPGRSRRALRALRTRTGAIWGLAAGLLLALVGVLVWQALRPPAEPPVESVAVLPIENQTSNPELDAYYEGIGTALIRTLSRIPGLNVVPELDVRRYRDTDKTVEEIAEELDVGTLIRGYVQGGGDEILVGVEVLSVGVSTPLWSHPFEGDPDELLTLQERIADGVLRYMPVTLSQRERERLRNNPTESREAWNAYFRGLANLEEVDDRDALERAAEYFERAVEADPGFAWAHTSWSEALWRLYRFSKDLSDLETASRHAQKAQALDSNQHQAFVMQSRIHRSQGQYARAVTVLREALKQFPSLDLLYKELALAYEQAQQPNLALENYRNAIEMRREYWGHWNELGSFYLSRGQFDEAREALDRARALSGPDIVWPRENLAALALMQARYETALELYGEIPANQRTPSLYYNMGVASTYLSRWSDAAKAFQRAVALQPESLAFRTALADTLLRQGDEHRARTQYQETLKRLDRRIGERVESSELQAMQTYVLARLDNCGRAGEVSRGIDISALPAEKGLYIARAHAICGYDESAFDALRFLLAANVSPERIRDEPAFETLVGDPVFEKLLDSASSEPMANNGV